MLRVFMILIFMNFSFASAFLDYEIDPNKVNIKHGEELYINKFKCHGCHGKKGERSSGTFPKLNTQSASELKSALRKYKDDKNYGGKTRFAMQRYSNRLSHQDIDDIVAYIKNGDISKDSEPNKKTANNLYLE